MGGGLGWGHCGSVWLGSTQVGAAISREGGGLRPFLAWLCGLCVTGLFWYLLVLFSGLVVAFVVHLPVLLRLTSASLPLDVVAGTLSGVFLGLVCHVNGPRPLKSMLFTSLVILSHKASAVCPCLSEANRPVCIWPRAVAVLWNFFSRSLNFCGTSILALTAACFCLRSSSSSESVVWLFSLPPAAWSSSVIPTLVAWSGACLPAS